MNDNSQYFASVLGNEALKKRLAKDVSEGMLSHAYVLEGPEGSGRHTIALSVAAAMECEAKNELGAVDLFGEAVSSSIPCGRCKSCEKILGGKSPDIITVGLEEDRTTMGVETIRDLKNDMFTAPNDLSIKVYIVENADLMTVQAQNAFLLSLEEPPQYVLFFLLCENSSNLLETVRSRAPTLRTERLTAKEIADHLLDTDNAARELKETAPEQWLSLLSVSQGSLGYAKRLLDPKVRASIFEYRDTAKSLIAMLSSRNKRKAFEAIASFGTKRPDVIRQISYLQYALRDLLLLKKAENAPLCFFENRDEAAELATRYTAKGLFSLYDASLSAIDSLESNANVRLTLLNMMMSAELL